ncbi:hypothetical protein WJX79_009257 [Trebouxia sp. C0005]
MPNTAASAFQGAATGDKLCFCNSARSFQTLVASITAPQDAGLGSAREHIRRQYPLRRKVERSSGQCLGSSIYKGVCFWPCFLGKPGTLARAHTPVLSGP